MRKETYKEIYNIAQPLIDEAREKNENISDHDILDIIIKVLDTYR